jgi:hypothetical protein
MYSICACVNDRAGHNISDLRLLNAEFLNECGNYIIRSFMRMSKCPDKVTNMTN